MFTAVLGILTLSCLQKTVLGEEGMLYRVDVTIPTEEGRDEAVVDASIVGILNQIKSHGIAAHLAVKTLDNDKYIWGVKGDDDIAMIKTHFEHGSELEAHHLGEVQCYATPMDIPLRLLYIGFNPPKNVLKQRMLEGTTRMKFTLAQQIKVVTEHCTKP